MFLKKLREIFRDDPERAQVKVEIGEDHSFFVDRESLVQSEGFKRAMKAMDEWEKERNQARQARENAAPKIATSAE